MHKEVSDIDLEKIQKEEKKEKGEKYNYQIAHEVAEEEFENFCEAWKLTTDLTYMTEDQQEMFQTSKNRLLVAIRKKQLWLNENEELVYKLKTSFSSKENLIMKRPSGRMWEMMDGLGKRKDVKKMNRFFAGCLGVVPQTLLKLDGIDIKMIQTVYLLFLDF